MIFDMEHYLRMRDFVKMGKRVLYVNYRLRIHSKSAMYCRLYKAAEPLVFPISGKTSAFRKCFWFLSMFGRPEAPPPWTTYGTIRFGIRRSSSHRVLRASGFCPLIRFKAPFFPSRQDAQRLFNCRNLYERHTKPASRSRNEEINYDRQKGVLIEGVDACVCRRLLFRFISSGRRFPLYKLCERYRRRHARP